LLEKFLPDAFMGSLNKKKRILPLC